MVAEASRKKPFVGRLPEKLVAEMYSAYQSGLKMREVGAMFGRDLTSVSKAFILRGLPVRKYREQGRVMPKRVKADEVAEMYALYEEGVALNEISRRFGRSRCVIRGIFENRGLPMDRPTALDKVPRTADGRIIPARPLSAAEIDELVATAPRIHVPEKLKREWRTWSLARRMDFIGRLRTRLKSGEDRPATAFSANVEPFDYGTPRARELVARINKGRNSRNKRCNLKPCSQGVIWRDQLWFWSRKAGYVRWGTWTKEEGRPQLHRVIWEDHHARKLPAHHVLRFADGNVNNLEPANIVVAARNDVCRENQAATLLAKSRERMALLLAETKTPNRKENANHGLLQAIVSK